MAGGDVEAIPPFAGTQYLSMLGRDAAAVLVAHEADHGIAPGDFPPQRLQRLLIAGIVAVGEDRLIPALP